ncbi:unnamed protein product [Cryptosporidium hominis]|uniref:THH1/TOM1/TOM3 domain-containing protein n=1 Tax=Cryptosporidium hominis TaxID=237895 RepID=A0A0S4TEY4_CRYHO|nr:hypothetical protein [Cryptosporidium hominis TU502]OLQ18787.1 putative integral membrane protein [Cryptosporidium hominis]PPA62594.1 hypothetical protein ChUKH1_12460 [Cryptosporidium hominis]PPS93154.1 Uncharacterized protein GY17_00003126 [Cryptosporidium hominis]CUV05479.1 unnamed protein product [Cryptosporidium hominis]|eukprot:PPS93154.1 Uncharacterized protein GY17_00003126 [Cryptosporidium hominis]
MDFSPIKSQLDDSLIGHSSFFGLLLNTLLVLIYFVLGALSVFQSLSALESNTTENVFETNGIKIRPYFLSTFSIGIIFRLLYIIVYLAINLLPKFIENGLINKLNILRMFDYLINIVFLASYSIVIALWSSIFTHSRSFEFTIITLLNFALYLTGGGIIIITLLITQKFPVLFNVLYILMGLLHLLFSYFWVHYGSSLFTQINRRQAMHKDLQKDLISKNANFTWNTNSNVINSGFNQVRGTNWLQYGMLNSGQVSIIQFNQDSSANTANTVNTASSSNNSNSSTLSGLFIYNKAYSSSINKLRFKIQVLTLVCPISLLISSLYYLLRGFGIVNSNPEILLNTVWTALYTFFAETIPSIALIYGFWSSKNSFLGDTIDKSYNRYNNNVQDNFRCYTRIY